MAKTEGGKRSTFNRQQLRDYLMQFLVVVAGILITFQGSAWIERGRERRESREILALVMEELNQNLEGVRRCKRQTATEREAMEFFTRYISDIRSAPEDSLEMYFHILGYTTEYAYDSDALEVLKSSPSSIKTIDKELLKNVFYSYSRINAAFAEMNTYYSMKYDVITGFLSYNHRRLFEQALKEGSLYIYAEEYLNAPPGNFVFTAGDNLTFLLEEYITGLENTIAGTMEEVDNYVRRKK